MTARKFCQDCGKAVHRSNVGGRCGSCSNRWRYRDATPPACSACGVRLRSGKRRRRCIGCYRASLAGGTGEGPRPSDAPIIHYYSARAMAGLPLFDGERRATADDLLQRIRSRNGRVAAQPDGSGADRRGGGG